MNKKKNPLVPVVIALSVLLVLAIFILGATIIRQYSLKKKYSEAISQEDKVDLAEKDLSSSNDLEEDFSKPTPLEAAVPEEDLSKKVTLNQDVICSGAKGKDDAQTVELAAFLVDSEKVLPEEILSATVDDYDRDGNYEGFFFVGSKMEYEEQICEYEGRMWYTDGKQCVQLEESQSGSWWRVDGYISCEGRSYAYATEYYTTGGRSRVWSVYNQQPDVSELDCLGDLSVLENGEVSILNSTYDTTMDEYGMLIGHSWKPYYFHYDKALDRMCEYGGAILNKNQIDEFCGFNLVGQLEAKGFEITNAYYRENGLLNVNYREVFERGDINFGNVNYNCNKKSFEDAWGNKTGTLEDSDYGGIYSAALAPDIATYPPVETKTEEIDFTVSTGTAVVPAGYTVVLTGMKGVWGDEWMSVVVDENTMMDSDISKYEGCETDMSAVEWLNMLVQKEFDDSEVLTVRGIYHMNVTNGHVDYIDSLSWQD